MASWQTGKVSAECYCPQRGHFTEQKQGITSGVFGIDERDGFFHITHLKTGCGTFVCWTEAGAKVIAEFMENRYAHLFAAIRVSGRAVSDGLELCRTIVADEDLSALRREFAVTDEELKKAGLISESKLIFIS